MFHLCAHTARYVPVELRKNTKAATSSWGDLVRVALPLSRIATRAHGVEGELLRWQPGLNAGSGTR